MDTPCVSFYKPETQKNNIIISTSDIDNFFITMFCNNNLITNNNISCHYR